MLLLAAIICVCFSIRANDFVLVIDPGHGGKDYGAIGEIANEKSINLAVAKQFGKLVNDKFGDVKVVFTRSDDHFVSLKGRADIANKAHGNLFVSIHVNSVDAKSRNRSTVQGASVYTLGLHRSESNLEVAKRENAVITLEQDYSTNYQGFDPSSSESYIIFEMNQNKHMEQSVHFAREVQRELIGQAGRADKGVRQAGFWVLWATSMPSVLVELDFICNPSMERYLASEEGQCQMSEALFDAFCRYKESYDRKLNAAIATVVTEPVAANKTDGKGKKAKTSNEQGGLKKAVRHRAKSTPAPEPEQPKAEPPVAPEQPKAEPPVAQEQPKAEPPVAQEQPVMPDSQRTIYRVQIFTHGKKLEKGSPYFKGLYPVWCYRDGGVWKYTYGEASSWSEAEKILRKVRPKFADAFIIATRDGKRVPSER